MKRISPLVNHPLMRVGGRQRSAKSLVFLPCFLQSKSINKAIGYSALDSNVPGATGSN
jgi:hypothetical protein